MKHAVLITGEGDMEPISGRFFLLEEDSNGELTIVRRFRSGRESRSSAAIYNTTADAIAALGRAAKRRR